MIERDHVIKFGGTGNISNYKWTRKQFYIFHPDFEFKGRLPIAGDFVKKVQVKILGVIGNRIPGKTPLRLKCKLGLGYWNYTNRDQTEIFLDPKEILESEKMKDHLKNFIPKIKENIENNIKYKRRRIEELEKGIIKDSNLLEIINNI